MKLASGKKINTLSRKELYKKYKKTNGGIYLILLQNVNLALRSLLEICALVAVGFWGFQIGSSTIMKMVLGIGAPIFIAVLWGVFGSPNSIFKLPITLHLILESLVFGIPAIALYSAGKPQLAWIYGICVVLNRLLMFVWKQ